MRKTGSLIVFLSALCMAVSAQTEEFRFKLYLESLSSGKKDTLEPGVGPNGMVGCDYDSTLCTVYTEPFFDTAEHIGAFLVPEVQISMATYASGSERKEVEIFDRQGRLRYTTQFIGGYCALLIEGLQQGLYLVRVTYKENRVTQKLVVR